MSKQTVAAGYVSALFRFALASGADRQALIERSGIRPEELGDPDNRVSLASCSALMNASIALCGDPAFALHFGEAVKTEELSIVWLIAGAAATVAEGLATANRHARLVRDEGGAIADLFSLSRDGRGAWLEFRSAFGDPHLVEAGFAWCVRETRAMLKAQARDWPFLKAVHFTHEEPAYRSEYDRIFQVPLVFGSSKNAFLVDEAFLSLKLPPSNPYVARVLSERADALLERLQAEKTARGRVESVLESLLHTGNVGMDAIAARLGLSRQTLYRNLRTEGVTYEKVLDGLRHKLALQYLAGKRCSVNETAYLVGFSEPAAFSRAFKRWTGKSPLDARRTRT